MEGGYHNMRKRKAVRYRYLLISLLFCLSAFAYWLIPTRSPTATCWVSGSILLTYGIIRIVTLPLVCLAFWTSIATKRHTLPQFIGGTLVPTVLTVLLYSSCIK